MMVLALLCIAVPTFMYDFYFLYSTQYFFLAIPLAATLVAAILTSSMLKKYNRQNATPVAAESYPSNAAYPMPLTVPVNNVPSNASAQTAASKQPESTWSSQISAGSQYYSLKAENLYAASEILKALDAIPPQTYYLVDTDDGTLGRDINGFFTESSIKTSGLKVANPRGLTEVVTPLSLMIFGDAQNNQSSVAQLKLAGQRAKLMLMMKCGHCGYESPIETDAGAFERQCYNCGSTNKTTRAAITVYTAHGPVEI